MANEMMLTRTQTGLAVAGIALLMVGVPILGIVLALVFKSMWWLVLLLPLFGLMEAGLFLIAVTLFVVAGIVGQ